MAEELHFRKAAEGLHISQPPLSQQIRQLEEYLGVPLFERDRRRVALTQAGTRFLPHARRILAAVQQGLSAARETAPDVLRVGFVSSATMFLVPMMRRFREAHPGVELRVVEASTSKQSDMLATGDIDIGLVRGPWSRYGYSADVIARDRVGLVIANDAPLASKPDLRLADFAHQRFVFFNRELGPGFFDTVIAACNAAGFSPQLDQVAGSLLTVISLVAAGQGYSLVPDSLARQSNGVTVRIPPDLGAETELLVAYPTTKKDDAVVRSLIDIVRDVGSSSQASKS